MSAFYNGEPTTAGDVVVVGGGAAGCVVAGRLAKQRPELTVILLERGPPTRGNATVEHPALFGANLAPSSGLTLEVSSISNPNTEGRTVPVLSGSVLGGGSAVNFMMYARPQARDFDAWKVPGWSHTELAPVLREVRDASLSYAQAC